MPTTTKFALPYPAPTDPADVPADMASLANRIDTIGGAANGLATLDGTGKLVAAQVPAGASGQLAYAQITASVSVTATTNAAAQSVISAGSVTYDGTAVVVEFYTLAGITPTVAGASLLLNLYDANTDLGILCQLINPGAGTTALAAPILVRRQLTPSAGAHTYNVRAWVTPSGTGTVVANTGAAAVGMPAYIKVSKA